MATRQQIIDGLRAELAKPELSTERRAQLQGALDHQLDLPPDNNASRQASNDAEPAARRNHYDRASYDIPASATRGHNYNAEHCLAAQMDKLPIAPMATNSAHVINNLKERRLIALEYVRGFKVRAECATTGQARAEDLKCQNEWAEYARELAAEITRTRDRIRKTPRAPRD